MKLLVVNNLASGFQDGLVYDYLRLVVADGDEVCLRCTDGTTDAATLVADANDFDVVIVSGGDGTIASIAYALSGSGVPILPFPAGTGNLLVQNLKYPMEPHALAKMTREMRFLDFDLGEIKAGGQRLGFCIMAGAGYDAAIMQGAKPAKKTLGAIAYFQAAINNALPQKSKIHLVIDGRTVESEGLGVVFLNFSRIQFEIPIAPGTDARDGMMDIAILKAQNAFGLIPALVGAVMDRDGEHPERSDSLEIYRGREAIFTADPPFDIQYDGEVPGLTTPMEVRVLDRAARFIVCEQAFSTSS